MKVLIAGGGTGGHIYPAITIGKALQEKGAELLFAGTKRGLEKEIVPREGFPLEFIAVDSFPRQISWRLVRSGLMAVAGVRQALGLVRRFQPDVCVGTGGYVAGPVVLAASLNGVATVIQEQNAVPGLTNRILACFVDKIALGYESAEAAFHRKDKLVVTGNPIRPEIPGTSRAEGARRMDLNPTSRVVLIFGASQGARSINQAVLEALPKLWEVDAQFIHATGESGYQAFTKECVEKGYTFESIPGEQGMKWRNTRILPYIHDMPAALAACDLVVGRGGALSISELTARGLPAILVPYPHAAENHQEKNARVMERAGAAKVILDAELTGENLTDTVSSLLGDRDSLRSMGEASRRFGKPEAVWDIVALIEGVVASRRRGMP